MQNIHGLNRSSK